MKNVPFIIYNLDRPRCAKLSTKAQFKIRRMGINLLGMLNDIKNIQANMDIPFEEVCTVLWACMEAEDASLNPETIGDLIMEHSNQFEALGKIAELVMNAMPMITGKTQEELNELAQTEQNKIEKNA